MLIEKQYFVQVCKEHAILLLSHSMGWWHLRDAA